MKLGDGVKIYQSPTYGREDATITQIDNATGIIRARTAKTSRVINNVVHVDNSNNTTAVYWNQLPSGYVPGSEGH